MYSRAKKRLVAIPMRSASLSILTLLLVPSLAIGSTSDNSSPVKDPVGSTQSFPDAIEDGVGNTLYRVDVRPVDMEVPGEKGMMIVPGYEWTYSIAPSEGPSRAMGCSVVVSASLPFIQFAQVRATATVNVSPECLPFKWNHQMFRLNTLRGGTYPSNSTFFTIAPGSFDTDQRSSPCGSSSGASSWSNRVNGTIYTSTFLACS